MNPATWATVVADLSNPEVSVRVRAAAQLHAEALLADVPSLLELLKSDDFFIREAAAWPLADLAGPQVIPELLVAYQRGFDEGHDNDGFTAALIEIPALNPTESKLALERILKSSEEPLSAHAAWLLTFCDREKGRKENDA